MAEFNFKFPPLKEWFNTKFVELVNCKARYVCLLGGRGSGKSRAMGDTIMLRMLLHKKFVGCAIRDNLNDVRTSCHAEIIGAIKRSKLDPYFDFTEASTGVLTIKCNLNNNVMLFGGQSDVDKIKSTKDLSFAWFEEKVPDTYEDFKIIDRSIRTIEADYCQVIFSINPRLDSDPEKHWFYNFFHYGEHTTLDFTHTEKGEIDGVEVSRDFRAIHSTFRDNRFISALTKFDLESERDPYLYQIDTLGKFARKQVGGRFYKHFDLSKHIKNRKYDPEMPLFVSFDFNTKPYLSILVGQMEGKNLFLIDEMPFRTPYNYSKKAISGFIERYSDHRTKLFITGDRSGYSKSTSQDIETGTDFKIIFDALRKHYGSALVEDRTSNMNPHVSLRGSFINTVFLEGYNDIRVFVGDKCECLIDDFLNGLEKEDGTKLKQNYRDKDSGETYEKYFHMADAFDYMMCNNFAQDYKEFSNPGRTEIVMGKRIYKESW